MSAEHAMHEGETRHVERAIRGEAPSIQCLWHSWRMRFGRMAAAASDVNLVGAVSATRLIEILRWTFGSGIGRIPLFKCIKSRSPMRNRDMAFGPTPKPPIF